jgi:hypothetical protein
VSWKVEIRTAGMASNPLALSGSGTTNDATPTSDDTLPLPDICLVALTDHGASQKIARDAVGDAWRGSGFVFT